jgi:hypothetical protein
MGIVERANQRVDAGKHFLPRNIVKANLATPELEQERRDAQKLGDWKKALKGKGSSKCPDEACEYLDTNMPGWRTVEESVLAPKTPKPPPPKTYADMSELEKKAIIESHLKQKKKGYKSTNPGDKDKINEVFASEVPVGKVVFLDHTEFKTAYALVERGVRPENMVIPQRQDNYEVMSKHELFGGSVVLGEFNDIIETVLQNKRVAGIYADYCSTFEKEGEPFIELVSKYKASLCEDAVIGVTITLRNPEGNRFPGQDNYKMVCKLYEAFPGFADLFLKNKLVSDDGPYTYGNGAPMATWMIKI